jgi:plastocyanin
MSTTIDQDFAPTGDGIGASPHHSRDDASLVGELRQLEVRLQRQAIRRDDWTLVIFAFAAVALVAGIVAVGFGFRAIDESKRNVKVAAGSGAAATSAPASAMVHLSEFKIEPAEVTVAAGGTLQVMNLGTTAHTWPSKKPKWLARWWTRAALRTSTLRACRPVPMSSSARCRGTSRPA